MKKSYKIAISIGGIALFFLLILPLVLIYMQSSEHISNSTSEIMYDNYGNYLSYYGAVLGVLVGGAITSLGVLITLDKQDEQVKKKREDDKATLLRQLKFSYDMLDDAYKQLDIPQVHSIDIVIPKLILDNDWLAHLTSVKCLASDDIIIIQNWFTVLRDIDEGHDISMGGAISGPIMKTYISIAEPDKIKAIIDKMESDSSC